MYSWFQSLYGICWFESCRVSPEYFYIYLNILNHTWFDILNFMNRPNFSSYTVKWPLDLTVRYYIFSKSVIFICLHLPLFLWVVIFFLKVNWFFLYNFFRLTVNQHFNIESLQFKSSHLVEKCTHMYILLNGHAYILSRIFWEKTGKKNYI